MCQYSLLSLMAQQMKLKNQFYLFLFNNIGYYYCGTFHIK